MAMSSRPGKNARRHSSRLFGERSETIRYSKRHEQAAAAGDCCQTKRRKGLEGFPADYQVVGHDGLGDILAVARNRRPWSRSARSSNESFSYEARR